MRSSNQQLLLLLALLGIVSLIFLPFLLKSPTPLILSNSDLGSDLPREIYPFAIFVKNTVDQELPLWRPYVSSGAMLIGHVVAPVFYPPNLVILVFSVPIAFHLLAIFHLWWLGVGMFLVIRQQFKLSTFAALVAALLLAMSPKWIAHLSGGHQTMLAAIAWFPWAWYCLLKFQATQRLHWAIDLGLCFVAQVMNYGNITIITVVVIAGIWLLNYGQAHWLVDSVRLWGVVGGVAFTVSAIFVLPLLDMFQATTRANLSATDAVEGSLPPLLLLATYFPPELKYPEYYVFIGVTVVWFASFAWATTWSRIERQIAILGMVALVLSLGRAIPIYMLLVRIPGLSLARIPARWWLVVVFSACILAAFGIQKWLNGVAPQPRRYRTLIFFFALIYGIFALGDGSGIMPFAVIFHAILLGALILLTTFGDPHRAIIRACVLFIVIADVVAVSTYLWKPVAETDIYASSELTAFLETNLQGGERVFSPYDVGVEEATLATTAIHSADGYDAFHAAHYADVVNKLMGCEPEGYVVSIPAVKTDPDLADDCDSFDPSPTLLALLNVRYVMLPEDIETPLEMVMESENWKLYATAQEPYGLLIPITRLEARNNERCAEQLDSLDLPAFGLVESGNMGIVDDKATLDIVAIDEGVNDITYQVNVSGDLLLMRSIVNIPGWHVEVDGQAAAIVTVNCAFQGVYITKGEHSVRFYYQPDSFEIGKIISAIGILLTISGLGFSFYQTRHAMRAS